MPVVTFVLTVLTAAIQAQGAHVGGNSYGLDPAFIKDPFQSVSPNQYGSNPQPGPGNTYTGTMNRAPGPGYNGPNSAPPPYQYNNAGYSNPAPSNSQYPYNPNANSNQYQYKAATDTNQYQYNAAPAPNQYQYNSNPNPPPYQYGYQTMKPTTRAPPPPPPPAPAPAPTQPPAPSAGEYEAEDYTQGGGAPAGYSSQSYAAPRARSNWYYGSRGAGLLDRVAPPRPFRQRTNNAMNNPFFYWALGSML